MGDKETGRQKCNYVHNPKNCPEWKNTQSSIPIPEAEILRNIGFSDEDIRILEEEKESYKDKDKLIASILDTVEEECNA